MILVLQDYKIMDHRHRLTPGLSSSKKSDIVQILARIRQFCGIQTPLIQISVNLCACFSGESSVIA